MEVRFLFFFGYAATQLARQVQQHRIQMVYSNKIASKALPQWTLNLEAYAHTCKQKKESEQSTHP